MTAPKKLIVLRHCHRDIISHHDDNGLSSKGIKQAQKILEYFKNNFETSGFKIHSSPRLRCLETVQPLADMLGIPMQIDPLLNEGFVGRLEPRIAEFFEYWKEAAPQRLIICSHGDWIPPFFQLALRQDLDLKKGGWAELNFQSHTVKLDRVIQSFE